MAYTADDTIMEKTLRKYGWLITLGITFLVCLMCAFIVNSVLASKLAPYTVPTIKKASTDKTPASTRARRPSRPQQMARKIEKRCLFGCKDAPAEDVCAEKCQDSEVCKAGACVPKTDADQTDGPGTSALNVKLLGVMVAKPAQYSSALLQEKSTKQTIILNVGDMLLGASELIEVKRDRIVLERNGAREFVKLEDTITASTRQSSGRTPTSNAKPYVAPPSTGPTSKSPTSLKGSIGPLGSIGAKKRGAQSASALGIKEISDGKFQIQRDNLTKAIDNKGKLAIGGTLVPNFKNGKRNGIKMLGLDPKGVYSSIGLRTGDVVTKINGTSIRSQAHAMEMLQSYKKSSSMTIAIERGGQSRTLDYSVK